MLHVDGMNHDSELCRIELLTKEDMRKVLAPLFDRDDDDDVINDIGLAWFELNVEQGGLDLLEHAMEDDPNNTDWIPHEMGKRVRNQSEGGRSQAEGPSRGLRVGNASFQGFPEGKGHTGMRQPL
jgi:hypothetical protein